MPGTFYSIARKKELSDFTRWGLPALSRRNDTLLMSSREPFEDFLELGGGRRKTNQDSFFSRVVPYESLLVFLEPFFPLSVALMVIVLSLWLKALGLWSVPQRLMGCV